MVSVEAWPLARPSRLPFSGSGVGGLIGRVCHAVGSGVAAGGAVRIIMDLAGISDVTSKSLGSNTPINVIRATMDGLSKLK